MKQNILTDLEKNLRRSRENVLWEEQPRKPKLAKLRKVAILNNFGLLYKDLSPFASHFYDVDFYVITIFEWSSLLIGCDRFLLSSYGIVGLIIINQNWSQNGLSAVSQLCVYLSQCMS